MSETPVPRPAMPLPEARPVVPPAMAGVAVEAPSAPATPLSGSEAAAAVVPPTGEAAATPEATAATPATPEAAAEPPAPPDVMDILLARLKNADPKTLSPEQVHLTLAAIGGRVAENSLSRSLLELKAKLEDPNATDAQRRDAHNKFETVREAHAAARENAQQIDKTMRELQKNGATPELKAVGYDLEIMFAEDDLAYYDSAIEGQMKTINKLRQQQDELNQKESILKGQPDSAEALEQLAVEKKVLETNLTAQMNRGGKMQEERQSRAETINDIRSQRETAVGKDVPNAIEQTLGLLAVNMNGVTLKPEHVALLETNPIKFTEEVILKDVLGNRGKASELVHAMEKMGVKMPGKMKKDLLNNLSATEDPEYLKRAAKFGLLFALLTLWVGVSGAGGGQQGGGGGYH